MIRLADAAFYLLVSLAGVVGTAMIAGFGFGVFAQQLNMEWLKRVWVKVVGIVVGFGIVIAAFAMACAVRSHLS